MFRKLVMVILTASMLSGCSHKGYITVVAPPKSAEEKKAATAAAEHIFPTFHGQGFAYMKQELAKPEMQAKLREKITGKIDNSSLGKCLNDYGFGDYLTKRMLADMTTEKLREETIKIWVSQLPTDMLKKADRVFSEPTFKRIFMRMRDIEGVDIRTKLNQMVREKYITDSQANEFILTTEDRDIKSFIILANYNVKPALDNLLSTYTQNPAVVVLEFMKTHPSANAKCSLLKGSSL